MLPAQNAYRARQLLIELSSMVAEEHNAQDLYRSVLEGPFVHELMLTNYAGYQVRTEYGNLRIENLWQPFDHTGSAKSVGAYCQWKTWNDSSGQGCVSDLAG